MRRLRTAISEQNRGFRALRDSRRPASARLNSLAKLRRLLLLLPAVSPRSGIFVPKLSLPVRLALLVAGTTLPLIVFAAGIVFYNYKQDRKDATQRVLETVRSIRLVLDAEVQRMTGGLQVLSLTNSLRNGDFDSFRRIALGFLEQYGKDGVVLVADRERPAVVLLGHGGYREPAAAQQPRYRRQGVCDAAADLFEPVHRRGEEAADRHRRGAGHARGRSDLRHLLQPADRDFPGHHRKAAAEPGLDDLDLRRRRHQFRAGPQPAGDHRQARVADAVCGDVPQARGDACRRSRSKACR